MEIGIEPLIPAKKRKVMRVEVFGAKMQVTLKTRKIKLEMFRTHLQLKISESGPKKRGLTAYGV